jgi:hypothetical protein
MSAIVVPDYHINALVSWAGDRHGLNSVSYWWNNEGRKISNDQQRVASILYAENVRSVNYRYGESTPEDGFVFKRVNTCLLKASDVIKACHGYSYQASETGVYEQTEAHKIIRAIELAAIKTLPGYQDSDAWTLCEPVSEKWDLGAIPIA